MSNPLVRRGLEQGIKAGNQPATPSAEELNSMYMQPSAEPQRPVDERAMTYDDVLIKTGICFAVLLAGAVLGWFMPILALPAMLLGLVLGLVNAFKREPNKGLILLYAGVEGVFLGGISGMFNAAYDGIVVQAVLATLCVFGLMFALFRFRIVRMSGKMMKFLMLAVGGYAIFALVNFAFAMFTGGAMNARNVEITIMGMTMPLGVVIGIVAVVLASLTLVADFQMIEEGVKHRIPEKYSWTCAFSLMVTLIWLYVEILRLLSYFRQN
ncbi:Bax inhibitor-1/YccA family protein [Brevibacterium luteolum]|uniref:Bax inhibitor-1/YccA family protein n=1 Tax=Brevibacterium luteolum TaxID=199591 RepID=UPI00223C41CD|nr:Bax inhibitor-1/YccA family protein [Brevibacterium luteolum]MCT1656888.1 Bax inhibitor-1/YccA family protein [Brevibacterium luteolum]